MKKAISFFLALSLAVGIAGPAIGESRLVPPGGISQGTADSLYVNVSGDTVTGNFAVDGDTTLGNAIGDTVTVNAGTVNYDSDVTFTFSLDAIFTAVKGLIRLDTPTVEVTGKLEVQGITELGDNVADTVTSKAGTWTFPNVTTINADAAMTLDSQGQTFTFDFTGGEGIFKGPLEVNGLTGITFNPNGDNPANIFHLEVTGNPSFDWDDVADRFECTHRIEVADATTATDAMNRQTSDARYVQTRSPITVAFSGDSSPYFSTTSGSYIQVGVFYFPGTSAVGTPSSAKAVGFKSANPTTWDVLLYDLTNSLQIAEKTGNTATASEIVDFGTLSNLPSSAAMIEVQLKRTGGVGFEVYLQSVSFLF